MSARQLLRYLIAAGFVSAGVMHFSDAGFFRQIVPPQLPVPAAIVAFSGAAEIAGGIGILVPSLRRPAGYGLVALLICVFPANLYMALNPHRAPMTRFPAWALWARLPLQLVFIAAVCFAAFPRPRSKHAA